MARGDRIVLAQKLYQVGESQLSQMPARVERKVQDAVARLGARTRDMARRLCPKRSGALVASIYSTGGGRAAGEAASAATPFARQSTVGYFRAVNAAIRRSAGPGGAERLFRAEEGTVHAATQRPLAGGGFSPAGVSEIGGHKYRSYTHGAVEHISLGKRAKASEHAGSSANFSVVEGGGIRSTEFDVQSIMEAGAAGRAAFFVTVGAAAHYAGDVEFGHVISERFGGGHVEARPFMRPALAWARSELPVVVGAAVREGCAGG